MKLVYIDLPFDEGADFTWISRWATTTFTKRRTSVIEEIAYRDTWG